MTDPIRIESVASLGHAQIVELSEVLIDCVEGGASVSFMLPMTRAKAAAFWQHTAESLARGELRLLVATEGIEGTEGTEGTGTIVGTVQVLLDQPENQPHRGVIAKMLVHRRARRHGVGAALLREAERLAYTLGKTLLVLDTASGDAERLYARQGWQYCGEIPDYALWPGGGPCATKIFYKFLSA
jgi:GNAT superfamily N-acetyltransferase